MLSFWGWRVGASFHGALKGLGPAIAQMFWVIRQRFGLNYLHPARAEARLVRLFGRYHAYSRPFHRRK